MADCRWARHIGELEDQGWSVVPDIWTLETCARARAHLDDILAPRDPGKGAVVARSHPIPGGVHAAAATAIGFARPPVLHGGPRSCSVPISLMVRTCMCDV